MVHLLRERWAPPAAGHRERIGEEGEVVRLRIAQVVDEPSWDAAVAGAGGSVFHSSAWAHYVCAERPNAVPQFLTLEDGAAIPRAFGLGFRARSRRPVLGAVTGRLWLDALPVASSSDGAALREFMTLLEAEARRAGDLELFVGSFGSGDGTAVLLEAGFLPRHRIEFVIELDRPEEQLWMAMDGARRRNVNKSGRLGVTIHELSTAEGVVELRRLQVASGERIIRRGGPRIGLQVPDEQDPIRVLLERGAGRIFAARVGPRWGSAVLLACFNGKVYHVLSGSSPAGLEAQATTLLFWEAIKLYRREGARGFNLGGCAGEAVSEDSPEHGVYAYKSGFGAERHECVSGHKVLRQMFHKTLGLLKRASGGFVW